MAKTQAVEEGREFFRRVAKEGAFAPVFFFFGDERFLVDEAISRVSAAVFPSGRDDFNFVTFHGPDSKGNDIVNAVRSAPMFAPRRLVIVRSIDRMPVAELEPIAAYLDRPVDFTILVLEAAKPDKRLKSMKKVVDSAVTVEFPELVEREVMQWTARRARTRNLTLAADVPDFLVHTLGTSLRTIDLALERIDLFLGNSNTERPVTLDVVQDLITDTRARNVFELTNQLGARDLAGCVETFGHMMEQGEAPIGAVSMIARQFRILLIAREGMRLGWDDRDLAVRMGVPPFRVREYKDAARRFSEDELVRNLRACLTTDHALKSSRVPRDLKVEQLLAQICLGAAGG